MPFASADLAATAPSAALMAAPRALSPSARESVEDVARSHIEQGLHDAAQLAVYRDGELQIDLRLGPAARPSARMLWFSATKPLAAVAALMMVERLAFDLDLPIASAWPQFGEGGKGACTLRHVLTHRGGFSVFPRDFDWERLDDWNAVTAATAAIEAEWPPGTATGYHPVTYGFALGELVRRLDGREPRDFLADEILGPLGMDASLGVPEEALGDVVPLRAMSEVTLLDPTGSERRTSDIVDRFNAAPTLRGAVAGRERDRDGGGAGPLLRLPAAGRRARGRTPAPAGDRGAGDERAVDRRLRPHLHAARLVRPRFHCRERL